MKIAIFGCGYIYSQYKDLISSDDEIVAILDNDVTKHATKIDGIMCIYPREYASIQIDFVIIMSDAAIEMKTQLIRGGCPEKMIVHYRDYFGSIACRQEVYSTKTGCPKDKKLLIISNELGYHGGPIVAMRTAKCAKAIGYDVTIAASKGQEKFIRELNNNGIDVVIQEWLMHASWDNLQWVKDFDAIIVNTYPMIKCAIEISKHRNVIFWLHESVESYYELEFWHEYIRGGLKNKNLKIYAVTRRASENFYRFYGDDVKVEIFSLAIEDWNTHSDLYVKKSNLVYAVIGGLCETKGQDIFLNALKKNSDRMNNKYLFVGKVEKNEFTEKVKNDLFYDENVLVIGERSQKEIQQILCYVDIVVVPSRAESFSMVAAESMMMGKVCIISDNCGISDYIDDGKNGFIFRSDSADDLRKIMIWCENHKEALSQIGKNARETYEHYFSVEIHKRRLEEIL